MHAQSQDQEWTRRLPAPLRWGVPAVALFALLWWTEVRPPEPHDPAFLDELVVLRGQLVDAPAPAFQLRALDGTAMGLDTFRGEWVFLNFWASWCEPCREEMPAMARLAASMRGRPFRMVAISIDEDPARMVGFLQEAGIDTRDMVILHDPTGVSARSYGTVLLPETYWIDPNGRIAARFQGDYAWDHPEIRRALSQTMQRGWKRGTGERSASFFR